MKKCIKRISIVIMFLLLGLILYPNSVNAKNVSSDFIKIKDHSYTYTDEELAISEVHFSNGVLNGKMENLSDYYLSVQMTIDYYDENYNIVARSTKTEKPGKAKENYMMNIILYKDDFIENQNINDIKYFKINYYTVKGNKISKDNLTINEKESYNNIVLSKSGYYRNYDYVIDSYNVDIKVNENNTYDITETIGTYFNVSKHGIYRTIPLRNTVQRLDGTTDKNRAKISKLQVSDKYTTSKENGNYKIKIGSKDITLTGKKDYVISYNYNIGKDRSDSYDEVYFNIIGPEWDTVIGDITFTITMPKEFDKEKLGFSSGTIGSTNSSRISYTVDKNVIKGRYNGVITPGEALTFRIELPDGYFINAGYQIDMVTGLFFLVPLFGLIVAFLLWCKFGKDEQVIETVEFYPPEGYNSLEIGYLYKGRASNEDVTSLLVYLANKGYIKITEKEPNSIFSSFKITKLKEYDGDNDNEREFLKGLFKNHSSFSAVSNSKNKEHSSKDELTNVMPTVTKSDLYDSFYRTMNKILRNINSKKNNKKIFETATSPKTGVIVLMIIISLITIIAIPTLEYANVGELGYTLFIVLFYVPFYAVGLSKGVERTFRIAWLGFTIFHSAIFFSTLPLVNVLKEETIFLVGFLWGILCIAGMIVCLKSMPRRTKYGNEILGKIRGFKTFLETAEKEKLELLVMQEPSYFYDILPYTYVLGVSKKWISQFETISLQSPDWYDSSSEFSIGSFSSFMNDTMSSAKSAMSSSPSNSSGGSSGSSGGGSSGGGSSGGGSGGGGGGSW